MVETGVRPDLVLCSTAHRTRETFERLVPALRGVSVLFEDALYGATDQDLINRLRRLDEAVRKVMVIGHNPGMERLAGRLAGSGDPDLRARLAEKYPTCGLTDIEIEAEAWGKIADGGGRLAAFVRPSDLEEGEGG